MTPPEQGDHSPDREPIGVLIVDDAPLWRQALRADLERQPDIAVVGEAADGRQAVQLARRLLPDVVLMDLSMPVMGGVEATRLISQDLPGVRVLVLTQLEEDEDVVAALRAGAVGYLLKDVRPDDLISGVRRVARGEVVFSPRLAGLVLAELRNPTRERPAPVLTPGEQAVLRLLGGGAGESEIAGRCDLTVAAVRVELRNISFKLAQAMQPKLERHRTSSAGETVRRSTGQLPPLPRDFSGAARYWTILVVLLLLAGLLGLGAVGGQLDRINSAMLGRIQSTGGTGTVHAMRTVGLLGSLWAVGAIRWVVIGGLVLYRRWQHLVAFLASILVVGFVVAITTTGKAPVAGVVVPPALAGNLGPAGSVAGLAASLVGVGYGLVPRGRLRRVFFGAAAAVVLALALAEMRLGHASPSGVVAAVIIGIGIPLLAFRLIAPEAIFPVSYQRGQRAWLDVKGPRRDAIVRALADQLGITVLDVLPFSSVGAAGSTPIKLRVKGTPDVDLFGKLYATSHMYSDRWYKLGRMVMYGSLEDEKPFSSVRRLTEYEDYILRYLQDYGIPSAEPYGVVELTPEREYLIVTEFLDGSTEILDPELSIDRDTAASALAIVRSLWDAGLAHRDIKPSNLLVRENKVYLIDAAFCEVRPTPWRQAVDLANMMLVLGLRLDPVIVYAEAERIFSAKEIGEAFAATHSVTMPAQLRSELKNLQLKNGAKKKKKKIGEHGTEATRPGARATRSPDLVDVFRRMAPARDPIPIQRWSVRRVAVTAALLAAAGAATAMTWTTLRGLGLA